MKLFWTIIGLLIALAAATLMWPSRRAPDSSTVVEAPAPIASPSADEEPPSPLRSQPAPREATAPSQNADAEPVRTIGDMTAPELADRLRAEAARIAAANSAESAGSPTPAPAPASATAEPPPSLDRLLGIESSSPASATPVAPPEPPAQSPPPSEAPSDAVAPDLAESDAVSEIAPMRSRAGEDGWTILDERFPIRGAGLPDDPYEVSWELLVSASETYQPRLGKTRLPERIAMLNGKFVRVTGYVAFPIMAMEQNELLSMRNMWDGCCIGTPPTPYDAIEVRLQKAATGQDRFTAFGSIEGLFKVDPYVKGNWLLGLYLMEDAKLTKTRDVEMPKPTHERPPGF
jgi:hypothetical protein